VDTRDNVAQTSTLARNSDVQSADLIVGPIFPKEISAFASAANLGYSLQVSPLAASAPSVFNIGNLVSLVAPIDQHAEGLADYLTSKVRSRDRIIIYNSEDSESVKFLVPLTKRLNEIGKGKIDLVEINNLEDLDSRMTSDGKNYFITALLNKFAVDGMLVKLTDVRNNFGYDIQLIGHPNWAKSSFQSTNLRDLNTIITTSYHVDPSNSKVRSFQQQYNREFKIDPSEFAYKGYDTGYFFGSLLTKYGPDYAKSLLDESYKGLQTSYTFNYNPKWGYVNTFIQILQFDGYQYQPIK